MPLTLQYVRNSMLIYLFSLFTLALCELKGNIDVIAVRRPNYLLFRENKREFLRCEYWNIGISDKEQQQKGKVFGEALVTAALTGNLECIRWILQTDYVHPNVMTEQTDHEKYALISAVHKGWLDAVTELLNRGAGTEVMTTSSTNMGWTPMVWAAAENRTDIIRVLFEAGAVICREPVNAFSFAQNEEVVETLKALVKYSYTMPGYYLAEGDKCEGLRECEPGYYCPGFAQKTNERFPCPQNSYSSRPKRTGRIECIPCPKEKPHSPAGSSSITACYGSPTTSPRVALPALPNRNGKQSKAKKKKDNIPLTAPLTLWLRKTSQEQSYQGEISPLSIAVSGILIIITR